VCKRWWKHAPGHPRDHPGVHKECLYALENGYLSLTKWLVKQTRISPPYSVLAEMAARTGNLAALKWMWPNGSIRPLEVSREAVRTSQTHILDWLVRRVARNLRDTFLQNVWTQGIDSGSIQVLEWTKNRGYACLDLVSMNTTICKSDIQVIQWLVANGALIDTNMVYLGFQFGTLSTVLWLLGQFSVGEMNWQKAAMFCHMGIDVHEKLDWLIREKGLVPDVELMSMCRTRETLRMLYEARQSWEGVMEATIRNGSILGVTVCLQEGCPWDDTYLEFADNENILRAIRGALALYR